MKQHRASSMSRAFDSAFNIIKASHFQATYGPDFFLKAIGGPEVEAMRSYVQMNENHPHPEVQQSVEDVYEHLTALASGRETPKPRMFSMQELSEMRQSGGPMSTEDPQGTVDARATPMQKAFRALLDAHFLRKNVVGMQDGQEYSMPPSIASMAQRPQVPETMQQTMQTQAPGMFGRFKKPVTQTAQIPTGQTALGGPQTMNVQGNLAHPMGGSNIGAAPGARVTRMPRPGPYGGYQAENGYGHNINQDRSFSTYHSSFEGQEPSDAYPMGQSKHFYQLGEHGQAANPFGVTPSELMQDQYGDQFNPNRQF